MHIQSQAQDGEYFGWDDEREIPADHRKLTQEEIQQRLDEQANKDKK